MTDAKRLLEQATPLPWIRPWAALTVRAGLANENDVLQHQVNLDLAVYAVNHLPDYLAAVEGLEQAVAWIEKDCRPEADWAAQGHNWNMSGPDRERGIRLLIAARAALARLREKVPA